MINQVYRLIAPGQIRTDFVDMDLSDDRVFVRPTYLSICAADQRYYTGSRPAAILREKLPMALLHEAVGKVVYDSKEEFTPGTEVVLIPNTPSESDPAIKDNYLTSTEFRSSSMDGFMQGVVKMRRDLILPFHMDAHTAVFLELVSVAVHAAAQFKRRSHDRKEVLGVWGDGSLGFVVSLILKTMFPQAKVILFGADLHKMSYFHFVDESWMVDCVPETLKVDHAFECVGGGSCERAVEQILEKIRPQGTVCLMGVSENPIAVGTRMVLEKGLTLVGSSRSSSADFREAISLLENHTEIRECLLSIISDEIVVRNVYDIHKAFENDLSNEFKTILKWEI